MTRPAPRFAIAIPMLNEAATVPVLLGGCLAASEALGPFEICVTDDGSTDGTGAALRAFRDAHPGLDLTIVTHPRPAGQSAAIHAAVSAARAPIIATLDGDGQNPPEDLPKLLAPLLGGARGAPGGRGPEAGPVLGLVAGQRLRRDDPLPKRLASRAANKIRGALLRDGTRDTGCGLKAFQRDAYLALPYFDHMHRYLPALFQRDGWQVAHVDVTHRPRQAGASKYTNLGRALVGLFDLAGVAWLIRRRRRVLPRETRIDRAQGPE